MVHAFYQYSLCNLEDCILSPVREISFWPPECDWLRLLSGYISQTHEEVWVESLSCSTLDVLLYLLSSDGPAHIIKLIQPD